MSLPLEIGSFDSDGQTLDFVCSPTRAIEQEMLLNTKLYWRKKIRYVVISFIAICLSAAFLNLPVKIFQPITLFALFLAAIPIEVLLWLSICGHGVMPFPTNLRLTQNGLTLLWPKAQRKSHTIDWHSLEEVLLSEDRLHFVLNTNSVSNASWWELFCETYALRRGLLPFISSRGKFNPARLHLVLPLASLTLDSDRQRFLETLKANVPQSAINPSLEETAAPQIQHSYTQLWLDDLHSARRVRMDDLSPGSTLQNERYEVAGLIAIGGQAKIYRAIDRYTMVQVVLKEIVLPLHGGLERRERAFDSAKNEALLLAKLDHPGIVKLTDHFVEDHRVYLVLENIYGQTLRRLVQSSGPLSDEQVAAIAISTCEILGCLHQSSPPIVHRDLSPDNLMITETGQVKMIDFTLAKDVAAVNTRTVVGKNNYIAPEQFKGKPTTQSDLYSLGATLYYLLTGSDPVAISTSSPSDKIGQFSTLNEVVRTLTQTEPERRYASAEAVMKALADSMGR